MEREKAVDDRDWKDIGRKKIKKLEDQNKRAPQICLTLGSFHNNLAQS